MRTRNSENSGPSSQFQTQSQAQEIERQRGDIGRLAAFCTNQYVLYRKPRSGGVLFKFNLPVYNRYGMKDQMIRVSEADAATNFASLLDRVRAGAEVIIEDASKEIAVLRPPDSGPGRKLSESIAIAEEHARKLGYTPTLDADFATDLEEIAGIHRQPLNPPTWD